MIKKIFDKHETLICILLIVLYVVTNSLCMQNFGLESLPSVIINTALSLLLILLIFALKAWRHYGFVKVGQWKNFLYFIPLVLIASVNLWNGININNTHEEILFHILAMINVGFIEEVIFRGFLFKMMAKDNERAAVIVSSVTFGIGHIVNLLNGAALVPTLLQICYAFAAGYLFVVIFQKSGSILPCIITHCLVNSLSIFNIDNALSLYIAPAFLIIIPLAYVFYINKVFKKKEV